MLSAASPGRTTSPAEPVYVFDLDGTVLTVNSFPLWVRHMLAGGPNTLAPGRRLAMAARTALALVGRKVLRRRHGLFKAELQRIWAAYAGDGAEADFVAHLMRYRSPALSPLVARVGAGGLEGLLATAAAEEYAESLARRLGFARVVATPRGRAANAENVGPEKRRTVAGFLEEAGWNGRPVVVFTDHLEDLPLIGLADRLIWCGAPESEQILRQEYPDLPLILAENVSASSIETFAVARCA